MPAIHSFGGWKMYMYYEDHTPPHFHLISSDGSSDFRVTFDGKLHSVKKGNQKNFDAKLIKEIVNRNIDILNENWNLMLNSKPLLKLK